MSRGIFPLEEQNSRIQNVKHETGISLQAFTCNHGRRRYKVDLKGDGRSNKRYEAKTRNSSTTCWRRSQNLIFDVSFFCIYLFVVYLMLPFQQIGL